MSTRAMVVLMCLWLALPGLASARGRDRVVVGGSITIPAGETVDGSVVTIGGGATLEEGAQVKGDMVAVLGSLELRPGAQLEGDAVALVGGIDLGEGARIRRDAVSILGSGIRTRPGASVGGDTVSLLSGPAFGLILLLALCLIPVHLAAWLPDLLLGLALLAFFPRLARRLSFTAAGSPGPCLLWGILGVCASPVLYGLLAVTVVGLLLWPVLTVFYMVAGAAGLVACGQRVGEGLEGAGWLSPGSFARRTLVGIPVILVALLALRSLPLLGFFAGAVALSLVRTVGVGAALLLLLRRTPPGVLD